jgi:hypothetical protein
MQGSGAQCAIRLSSRATENVHGAKMVLFADVTNLLITKKEEFDHQHKIIKVMKELETFFQKNNLIINTEKNNCYVSSLKTYDIFSKTTDTFTNIKITYQSQLRFLGTYITENLTWGSHAQSLRTKLCKVVYMTKILKKTMSP